MTDTQRYWWRLFISESTGAHHIQHTAGPIPRDEVGHLMQLIATSAPLTYQESVAWAAKRYSMISICGESLQEIRDLYLLIRLAHRTCTAARETIRRSDRLDS